MIIMVRLSRWRCRHAGCERRIFTNRLYVRTPAAVARQLLAAEEVVGTWASGDLVRRHPETRERCPYSMETE